VRLLVLFSSDPGAIADVPDLYAMNDATTVAVMT